jgi:hypothetical protein
VLNTPIPDDLCLLHREQFRAYRENHYSPRNPTEWPGGSHIMDSRVSHAERDRDWDRKNLQIMQDIADQCRSGRIPGCVGDTTAASKEPK